MPIFLNSDTAKRMPRGKRRAAPVRPSRRIALDVRRAISDTMKGLIDDIENLIPWLDGAATPAQAAQVMRDMQQRWREVYGPDAERLAIKWVGEVSKYARERLEKNIARSLGIDMTHIFDDKTVLDAAELMSIEARSLIVSVPEEYLAKVQQAVTHNYMQLPLPEGKSLTEYVRHLSGVSERQANIIARDQTSKINMAINQARQQEVGIEEYIWRTAMDRRVVGNPNGAYPEGNHVHGNHWKREGQIFRWDKPPFDGHPGYSINCRCVPEPIIEIDKLRNAA
jgi:hypothetical protein